MEDARATADGVRSEGLELVSNLREMSNSLRANAERLLGDVQRVHSRLVAQIERVERVAGGSSASVAPRRGRGGGREGGREAGREGGRERGGEESRTAEPAGEDGLEVPEFIPPG